MGGGAKNGAVVGGVDFAGFEADGPVAEGEDRPAVGFEEGFGDKGVV